MFGFPYPPYGIQEELMASIVRACDEKRPAILESPTGTGKSLSLFCALNHWLNNYAAPSDNDTDAENCTNSDVPSWVRDFQASQLERDKRVSDDARTKTRRERTLRIAEFQFRHDSTVVSKKRPRPVGGAEFIADGGTSDTKVTGETQSSKASRQAPQIIYCSRTHSQLAQFAQEMSKVKKTNEWQVVVLGSRAQMCVHPSVAKFGSSGGSRVNDACRALREQKGCRFRQNTDHVRDVVLDRVMDVEDIRTLGQKVLGCPYYATRGAAEEADFLLLPYGSLLHADTRQQLGVSLQDNIVVFDEAHNIFDAAAGCHSALLTIEPDMSLLRRSCGVPKKVRVDARR